MKRKLLPALLLFACQAFSQISAIAPFQPETTGQFNFGSATDVYGNEAIVTAINSSVMEMPKVFIFEKTASGMDEVAAFSPNDGQVADWYGGSVCIHGDYAAVGAALHDAGASNTGAVYLYHKNNGTWEFQEKVTAPTTTADEHFGTSVKLNGSQLFVGAPGVIASSKIYVFNLEPTVAYSQTIDDDSNVSVGTIFDVDGDRMAYYSYAPLFGTHHVTTLSFENGTWATDGGNFYMTPNFNIQQLRLDNGFLYVGRGMGNLPNECQVLAYHQSGTAWIEDAALPVLGEPDNILTDFDVSGNHMLVGLGLYLLQMERQSPLKYYKKVGGTWTYQNTLYGNGTAGHDDGLGVRVAMSPDLFVVGAPKQGTPDTGKAYYVNGNLGLAGLEHGGKIWPNPTNGELFIAGSDSVSRAEIYGVSGSLLKTIDAPGGIIDLSAFSQGMYFLKLFAGENTSGIHKIIRQ